MEAVTGNIHWLRERFPNLPQQPNEGELRCCAMELVVPVDYLTRVIWPAGLVRVPDIKLVVLDVDGVLTDGGLVYTSEGQVAKVFHVRDGMAITRALAAGIEIAIISAGNQPGIVEARARDLGIRHVYIGKQPKAEVLAALWKKGIAEPSQTAFVGDDVNDIEPMSVSAFSACPADAAIQVKRAVNAILPSNGGKGAVRWFFELFSNVFESKK